MHERIIPTRLHLLSVPQINLFKIKFSRKFILIFFLNLSQIRLVAELILLSGALLYILAALRESKFLGYHMFIENLVSDIDLFQSLCSKIKIVFLDDCSFKSNVSFFLLLDDDYSFSSFDLFN